MHHYRLVVVRLMCLFTLMWNLHVVQVAVDTCVLPLIFLSSVDLDLVDVCRLICPLYSSLVRRYNVSSVTDTVWLCIAVFRLCLRPDLAPNWLPCFVLIACGISVCIAVDKIWFLSYSVVQFGQKSDGLPLSQYSCLLLWFFQSDVCDIIWTECFPTFCCWCRL